MSSKTTKPREPLKALRPQLDAYKRNTNVKPVTQGGILRKPAPNAEKTQMKAGTLKSPRLRSASASATPSKIPKPSTHHNKCCNSAPSSAKKTILPVWKRKPKPAHSGVPVPEKMRKLLDKLKANGGYLFNMPPKT